MPGKKLTPDERGRITCLYQSGLTDKEIAAKVGRSRGTIGQALIRWGVSRRLSGEAAAYKPTPRKIRKKCKRLQAGWSDVERQEHNEAMAGNYHGL